MRAPLLRYVLAAALVRSAASGATIALVALAVAVAGPEGNGAAVGGVLAAMLTAPTLLAPVCARPLDRARDGRWVLAGSSVVFAVALTAGAALVGRGPTVLAAAVIGVGGLTTPLLTGGLSSRLAALAGPTARSQRRAEGWDAVTYGLGGSVGPAAVAVVVATGTPFASVVVLACGALAAAAVLSTLPLPAASTGRDAPPPARQVMRLMAERGPLRRVLVATTITAVGFGGLLVAAVVLGDLLSTAGGAGPALGAAFGLGNLTGSLAVAARPLRGEPERLTILLIAGFAVTIGGCALAPDYATAIAAFTVAGVVNGVLLPATLAVRSVYAPPEARAEVFVTMAAIKTVGTSAGTALCGVALALGPRAVLGATAALVGVAALVALVDRRLCGSRSAPDLSSGLPTTSSASPSPRPAGQGRPT